LKTNSFSAGKHLCYGWNLAVVAMRQVSLDAGFSHIGVTRIIPNNRCFYSTKGKISYFPLYLFSGESDLVSKAGELIGVNCQPHVLQRFADEAGLQTVGEGVGDFAKTLGPEAVLQYILAITHSNGYRARFAEFLRSDFPRLPLCSNAELLRYLCTLGADVVALHLLEDDYPAASWNLSKPKARNPLKNLITRFSGKGDAEVATGYPKYANGYVFINPSGRFEGVPEKIWNFHVGGYQVCEKWLKDRRGRPLSEQDILHYRRVVAALKETIRLMDEIDRVIEAHGGWPGAFLSGKPEPAKG
jgi:predicted helicase